MTKRLSGTTRLPQGLRGESPDQKFSALSDENDPSKKGMRALVRAPNWLGDTVMATPFIKRLGMKSAMAIDVLVKPGLAEIFNGAPGVNEVLTLRPGEGLWALAWRLRARDYAVAYILPPSFSSAFSCRLAGIPRRIGYASDFRSPLLTEAIPLDERFHYVRRYGGLLGEAGTDVSASDLYVPRASEEETNAFLSEHKMSGTGKVLAVAPGSRAPARRWFPDRFAQVINGLGSQWATVLLLGAPEDRPFADEVARLSRRTTINICGQTTLPLAASILARSTVFLTNESGLMHVGWAVGAPLVVLAGPSNTRVTSPFGPQVQVIQTRDLPCVPCVRNECYLRADDYKRCLKMIQAGEVIEKIKSISEKPQ
jgi:heptosyltransferase-2